MCDGVNVRCAEAAQSLVGGARNGGGVRGEQAMAKC